MAYIMCNQRASAYVYTFPFLMRSFAQRRQGPYTDTHAHSRSNALGSASFASNTSFGCSRSVPCK